MDAASVIELTVNGVRRRVTADPETRLVYVLRNDFGLFATRFGCGAGDCGACFVLVDGRPAASCDLPLSAVGPATITTVEGLSDGTELSRVQEAFVVEQAGQCGYCLSGMLITATALLESNPAPSEDEIRSAFDGNLCRCGSHNRVVRAVQRAASTAP
jgi:nicotinate dehydrogenase subunit A